MRINTHSIESDYFKWGFLKESIPLDFHCSKCKAKPKEHCNKKDLEKGFIYHQERMQKRHDVRRDERMLIDKTWKPTDNFIDFNNWRYN